MPNIDKLKKLCQLIRYDILTSTTTAGSGHPTSSLSAVELMATLFFATSNVAGAGFLKYDLEYPENPANDRVIFSKGHASPLLYALYHAASTISYNELMTLRRFYSRLEGHPTPRFPFVDVATGSLGQGLSIGVGMALGMKLKFEAQNPKSETNSNSLILNDQNSFENSNLNNSKIVSSFDIRISDLKQKPRVFVLLGDSEMSEGQVWEAMQIASYYKLNNLIAIVDVNRLGQRGETMLGWDLQTYAKRAEAFGWEAIVVDDGHDLKQIYKAFKKLTVDDRRLKIDIEDRKSRVEKKDLASSLHPQNPSSIIHPPSSNNYKPTMILAKTIKGKGISFLENKNGWHGKALSKEQLKDALKELGKVELNVKGKVTKPDSVISNQLSVIGQNQNTDNRLPTTDYSIGSMLATRQAYGDALVALGGIDSRLVALDAELSNSTYADKFKEKFPDRFFEMFIAEQNMISTAIGLEKIGYKVFASTFGSFFTRAFDQIRMAQYSQIDLRMVGSHTGVFLGKDGPSQMGLEDFSMLRSILNSTVLCGADAVATFKLTEQMLSNKGIAYLRTMREKLPVIYSPDEEFKIGGSKILRQSPNDVAVVFAVGITVHEALKAYESLKKEQISISIVDLYSVKPIDHVTIQQLAMSPKGRSPSGRKNIIVVEDHYPYGGLGEAVISALTQKSEARNPKSETMSNDENLNNKNVLNLENSNLEFVSNFDIRISNFIHLCVRHIPRSGTPQELLRFEEIDADAIIKTVKKSLS